jgi:hypothetical protein
MKSIPDLIKSLNRILEEHTSNRKVLIKELQNEVWNDESIPDERLNEFLTELAYDLDFYEPNEGWRKEDPSYYGDEHLNEIIKSGIKKMEEYKKDSQ